MSARAIAALALAGALAACGGGPRLEKLPADAVILAFGDSLTHGTGASPAEAYPAVLSALTGRKVVNAGVPGEVSAAGLERLPEALDEVRPALLLLCHGGNDFLRRFDDATAARNVKRMIALARERGIPVVLLATPKPSLPPSVPAFYAEIAKEAGVPFEDAVMREVLFDNRLKSDLVHPNAQGYRRIAEALHKLLDRTGAL